MMRAKRIVPGPEEVHVWRTDLDAALGLIGPLEHVLSVDERQRATRFHRSLDRERFVLSRAFLREVLSVYVETDPAELQFAVAAGGKPALRAAAGAEPVHFNLSHAEAIALLAVTAAGPVGIDIERVRGDFEHNAIARQYFSAAECQEYFRLGDGERPTAFARLWTRKEAYLKALGDGLSRPLESFTVATLSGTDAASPGFVGTHDATGGWIVFGIDAPPGFEAALATRAPMPQVLSWTWQPGTMLGA